MNRRYQRKSDPTGHAAAVFGKTMCTFLELLDMTDPEGVGRIMRQLLPESQRRSVLLDLAGAAETLRAGALGHRLRLLAGGREGPLGAIVAGRYREPPLTVVTGGVVCVPGRLEDGSDSQWFDVRTREKLAPKTQRRIRRGIARHLRRRGGK